VRAAARRHHHQVKEVSKGVPIIRKAERLLSSFSFGLALCVLPNTPWLDDTTKPLP
jgi:hypothetical protein